MTESNRARAQVELWIDKESNDGYLVDLYNRALDLLTPPTTPKTQPWPRRGNLR